MAEELTYTTFAGDRILVAGPLQEVLLRTKEYLDTHPAVPVLIFEDQTGQQVDFDHRGSTAGITDRARPLASRPGPGRPKLGVVSREVTLLPRHWEWLEQQPSGISAALRRLVEEARKREPEGQRARMARDATGKVMWTIAGDLEGFEEASRALFAGDHERFQGLMSEWPADIRTYLERIAQPPPISQDDAS